jgi:hypothetical protein
MAVASCAIHRKTDAMRNLALLFSLLVSFGFAAPSGAEEYKWIGQITEDGAALSYAIPQSDAIKLDFHCDRKTRKIVVNLEHEPKDAKDGIRLAIRLSKRGDGANTAIEIPATGQRLELDDKFLFQGETRMSPQLRRLFSDGGTLLISVNDQTDEIPLKGIAQAARQLLASCPS